MSEFKDMKFRVENEEHSKQIQEALFKLGYKWAFGGQEVRYAYYKYLYIHAYGRIYHGCCESEFEDCQYSEYKLINGEIIKATDEDKKVDTIQLTYTEAWEALKAGKEVFYKEFSCYLSEVNSTILYVFGVNGANFAPFHSTNKLFTMKKEPEFDSLGLSDDYVEIEVFGLKAYHKFFPQTYFVDSQGYVLNTINDMLLGKIKYKGDHTKAKIKVTVDKDGNITYEDVA
jgi:hypothetical protein